jgi:hypothetical protein
MAYFTLDAYADRVFLSSGFGYTVTSTGAGWNNDVWEYLITQNRWVFLRGSNTTNFNSPVFSGVGQTPHASSGLVARPINGTDSAIIDTSGLQMGSATNLIWIYSRVANAWMFLTGNLNLTFDEAASNAVMYPIGSSMPLIHVLGDSWNNALRMLYHGGFTPSRFNGFVSQL